MPNKSNRIREHDMEAAIYRPNANMLPVENNVENILVFTLLGKQDGFTDENGNVQTSIDTGFPVLADQKIKNKLVFAEDREEAYAKSVKIGYKTRYFIKQGSNGRLYNPTGLYNESRSSKIQRLGLDVWKFKEVDYSTFSHYLKFLCTLNQAWITTAERELI